MSCSLRNCCGLTKRAWLGLFAVILVAAAARLIGLGSLDPWNDEIYSHVASSELLPKLLRWETPGNESSSPWPFIEIKVARQIFGEGSALTLRMPSAVHGIIAVAVLYLVLNATVGSAAAFWSALLLAINPYALEWSREGRMYQQWLDSTIVLIGVAYAAVQHSRAARPASVGDESTMPARSAAAPVGSCGTGPCPLTEPLWLDWRWWLTGVLLMLVHAANVMGTMTIAGVALCLGIFGVAEWLNGRFKAGLQVLLGSALAGAVYLGSWGLTGIGKMLFLMGDKSPPAKGFVPPVAVEEFAKFLEHTAGRPPLPVALAMWVIASAGLILLIRRGHWRLALLIAVVSLAPWLGFPSISKRHFFTARYVYTGLILFCAGLGVTLATLWQQGLLKRPALGKAAAVALLAAGVAASWPYTREVFFVPKMAISKALAPVQQHARPGDAFVLVPDWYVNLDGYLPYKFGPNVRVVRGPHRAVYAVGGDANFKGRFAQVYAPVILDRFNAGRFRGLRGRDVIEALIFSLTDADAAKAPQATWLFMLVAEEAPGDTKARWRYRFDQLDLLLAAYGLKPEDLLPLVDDTTYTLTVRLSRDAGGKGVVDHVTGAGGRRHR